MATLPVIAATLLAWPGRDHGARALVSDRRFHRRSPPRRGGVEVESRYNSPFDDVVLRARRKVAQDEVETINESATRSDGKRRGFLSSFLRSTSQTEALGGVRRREETRDHVEEQSSAADDEILRHFSLLVVSQFVLFLGVGAVIPTIPLYSQAIGLSSSVNGVVISAPALALLLVSRVSGEFADAARKPAMMGGMAVIALSDVGTALANDLPGLVLARLGLGLGRGYAEAGERGMLTDLANGAPGLRGRALAVQQAAVGLGIALGAPAGGVVVDAYGPRAAFLCVSAAALMALGIYALLPETVVVQEAGQALAAGGKDIEEEKADWFELLRTSPAWRGLCAAQAGTSVTFACKIAVIPILANSLLGSAKDTGLLLSAAGLAGLVGAPLGGFFSDRAGPRYAAGLSGTLAGLSLSLIPFGLTLDDGAGGLYLALPEPLRSAIDSSSLAGGGTDAASFVALVLLWSVCVSAQGPALTSLAQTNAPSGSESTALGLPRAVGDSTYIAAPLVLGYVTDAVAEVRGAACLLAGVSILVGSAALLLLSEDDKIRVQNNEVEDSR